MRGLDAGKSYVVTRNRVPVGELRPLRRSRLVDAQTVKEVFRGSPAIDAVQLRRDLDTAVDQDVTPRD